MAGLCMINFGNVVCRFWIVNLYGFCSPLIFSKDFPMCYISILVNINIRPLRLDILIFDIINICHCFKVPHCFYTML